MYGCERCGEAHNVMKVCTVPMPAYLQMVKNLETMGYLVRYNVNKAENHMHTFKHNVKTWTGNVHQILDPKHNSCTLASHGQTHFSSCSFAFQNIQTTSVSGCRSFFVFKRDFQPPAATVATSTIKSPVPNTLYGFCGR